MLLNFKSNSKSNTTIAKLDGITVLWNNGKSGDHEVMFIGHARNLHAATGLPTALFVTEVKPNFLKVNSNSELYRFSNNPCNIECKESDEEGFDVFLSSPSNQYDHRDVDYPKLVGLNDYHDFKVVAEVLGA